MSDDHENMRQTLATVSKILQDFSESSETFRIVSSIPKSSRSHPPSRLYILDSSFNPPTRAHLHMARSALRSSPSPSPRLLLLLATQNADKASRPASLAHRLVMMNLFAQDLLSPPDEPIASHNERGRAPPDIDIGITKHPYFHDKAAAISASAAYPPCLPQTHLIGYDTLTRLLSTKYYPPQHTLTPLAPFFAAHDLLVTLRPDDARPCPSHQEDYIPRIRDGSLDHVGGRREWGERIHVAAGPRGEVSSTRAREAAERGDGSALRRLVSPRVAECVLAEELYKNAEAP